jgi:phosphodiesterase/alkaline phosphatase D-like protein
MPMRECMAEPGRVYRKMQYGPLLDVFMLDMRSYRGPAGHMPTVSIALTIISLGRSRSPGSNAS